jgi:hypothetical protein
MLELACLLLVLVWLYFWLSGHWFARVVGFLAILGAAGVVGFIAFLVMPPKPGPWDIVSVQPSFVAPDNKPHELTDAEVFGSGSKPPAANPFDAFDPPKPVPQLRPWENDPIISPPPVWWGSHWMRYGGLGLAGLLTLLSWPLASIPITYHRRARSRQTRLGA